MSDSGVAYWDIFYLSNFSLTSATETVSLTATQVTINGSTTLFDQLSSDGGGGEANLVAAGNASEVTVGTTIQDSDSDPSVTYMGQGVISTDSGPSNFIALFGETVINGIPVVVAYVPTGSFSSHGDFISLNPSVTITQTTFDLGAACFVTGTMIRTPDGDRAVETLRQGDLVVTADGAAKSITWLGRSRHSTLFAEPTRILPVRIRAGALGENLPVRDLLVSPGHAMLLDGVLVHAGAMVNGTSVVRETGLQGAFTYYHVETGAHDVLLAEGAATESFLVGVEEMKFDNWDERPAAGATPEELAYPRVKAARQMPRSLRDLLESRAEAIVPAVAVAA
jgi:hypothetical protein